MKIGIFGGTFDPPHIGHLTMADTAMRKFNLDRVYFVPANNPYMKGHKVTPAGDRLILVGAACGLDYYPSACEIIRGGPSYTVDTLRYFQKQFPDAELYLIVGGDAFNQINEWKEYEYILNNATIVVFGRPGYVSLDNNTIYAEETERIFPKAHIEIIPFTLDISSTKIRAAVANGDSFRYLVTTPVYKCIKEMKLYGCV